MDICQEEIEHKWLEAAQAYGQVLQSKSGDVIFAAESWQRIGFCYSLASRQAANIVEFKRLRQLAVRSYERAAELFGKDSSVNNQGKSAKCLATAEYTRSWLASSSSEKEKMLDRCRALGKKALEALETAGDKLNYAKTCNFLSVCLFDRLYITSTLEEKRKIAQEGIDNAGQAISILSKLENRDEQLFALSTAILLNWYLANISEHEDDRRDLADKCLNYSEKATALSKEVGNPYSKAMLMWAVALTTLFFTEKIEASLEYAKEMLQQASVMRDNYFKGVASYLIAFTNDWMVDVEANPHKKRQRYEEVIRYAEHAIRYLQLVCQDWAIAETYPFYAQSYFSLARDFAIKPLEKLALAKKAVRIGEKGLEYAIRSGSPDSMGSTLHALSKAYHYYSNLEPRKHEKPQLLRNALGYRAEYIRTVERAFATNLWTLGVGMVYAAQIEADLARLETTEESKVALLEDAISYIERGVSYCNEWIKSRNVPTLIATVAGFEDTFGGLLNKGYLLTRDKENLSKANDIYEDAAEKFKKIDLPSRVAESYWKIARNLDLIGEHQKAAENFGNAFAGYKAAAQKIHQFSEFYLDYATYMKAWSAIQTAKLAHCYEKYASAMQLYERISTLLKQSKLWSYLSSNFYAWSLLEQAEDLSRKESCIEAISAFEKAIKLFQESQRTLRVQLERIDKIDEKDLVTSLIEASTTREEYVHGRIKIEEAKIFDRQGDHTASSERYEAAAEIFQEISRACSEQTRKEIKPLIYLCQAWQKMAMAEARGSPILYEEAAELFKLANENSSTESACLLALAHSNFCKALETGTEFEITRNTAMYIATKKHMESAANYYFKAGFETGSEYAKATQRLFDAYVYTDNAKKETDPEKEARYYLMAEKVLQLSAESYTKARHPEKNRMVQQLLKKVREERELAVSLSEVLYAPTITSSTASFATISLSEEKAVGLERFEHADVQAKLIQHGTDIRVGEDASVEIQMVNVGKEPVLLTEIENILPVGFQLMGKPEDCSFEDTHLVMKGKRLDPLKTDEMKLVLKPLRKGTFEIKPTIICVDETGHQMLSEPEPRIFKVSEAVLPGRITTGYEELDNLMLGGIPKNYAVILASPSNDERELLIKRFLEAGVKESQISFYITAEPGDSRALAEEFQSSFYLFVCSPRADVMIKSLPNVFKLKGVESLTDIDIALTKSFRMLDTSRSDPKRACITIISDVLLQHHAVITRKWLSGVLPDLRAKGFTTLAVINPEMHPQEEVQAILGLFEGEVRLSEKETAKGLQRTIRIRKLYNQRYLDSEIVLERDKLES